jgi:hypothetical protein
MRAAAFVSATLVAVTVAVLVWLEAKRLPGETYVAYFATWYATTAIPSRTIYAVGIALTIGLLVLAAIRPAFLRHKLLFVFAYVVVLVVTLYGMRSPITLQAVSSDTLAGIEAHFTAVFGAAELLVNGLAPTSVGYGYLPNLLVAGLQKIFGAWEFADYVRFVQYGNVAYLAAALIACHLLARSRPMIAIGTLLLVAPWVHSAHQGLFFPNQAGWRFIAMPLAMAALGISARIGPQRASILLGAVSGFAIAWNPETGVAVAFGCATYLFLRSNALASGEFMLTSLRFAGCTLVVLVFAALFEFLAFGDLSLTDAFWSGLIARSAVGSGYGLPFYLDARAIVLGAFAGWVFAEAVVVRGKSGISRAAAQRAAIAAMGLCWGAYYVARPDPWNLWSYLLPFGFLVIDRTIRSLENWRQSTLAPAIAPAAIVALVLGPSALAWNYQTAKVLWRQVQIPAEAPSHVTELSGVRLDAAIAEHVSKRADYVSTVDPATIAFTGNSFLLPKLSGRRDIFPKKNFYFLIFGNSRLDAYVDELLDRRPETILLDSPATLDENGAVSRLMAEIEGRISSDYAKTENVAGWTSWSTAR